MVSVDLIDLSGYTTEELDALMDRVKAARKKAEKRQFDEAVEAAKEIAKKHGFSLDQLVKAKASQPKKSEPKFRNPDNPEQVWSGHGRRPQWIVAKMDAGVDIETMRI